jgi:ATP adenylyltransferase
MKKLWAPWRKKYITDKPGKACFICRIKNAKDEKKHFIVKKTRHSFAVLNLFPYNNGHLLIVPKRHVKDLSSLKNDELLDLIQLTNSMTKKIEKSMNPHGLNIGINMGRASGAGVPGHIHIHIVPRWSGDTNFMPVITDTKVVSESLESVYERLK